MGGFELKAAKLRGCTAWACGLTTSFGEAGGRGSTKPIVISKRHSGGRKMAHVYKVPRGWFIQASTLPKKGFRVFLF